MNKWVGKITGWMFLFLMVSLNVKATVYYVNVSNTVPSSPFTTWDTAATNIQDAINVSSAGDTVLVTNGVYAYGGQAMVGSLTNRVALTNAITVQSVNGPWVTTILGAGAMNGSSAVRCAWLTNGASLVGFTLTGGATQTSGNQNTLESGGGVWCASSNAIVRSCVIVSNTAYWYGGGVYQGTISGSLVSSNGTIISLGGATYQVVLNNCTIVSNAVYGTVSPFAMTNCIIYYNQYPNISSPVGPNYSHCCIIPALPGPGNFTNAPQFFVDGIHLANNSPCVGAGVGVIAGTDIFGMPWSNPPSIGCAEWQPSPLVTAPRIKLSGNPVGFSMGGTTIAGAVPAYFSWLKDGLPLQDDGHFNFTQSSNLVVAGAMSSDAGNYQLVVSNAFGVVTSAVAQVVIHCVDVGGINPVPPFSTWDTAATNIQDAISAAVAGDIVLVTNGLYATGGKSMDGVITNRVVVDKAILVQSVKGPGATIIQGAWDAVATNGPGAVRCVWMTNNAILGGFTLQGGATQAGGSTSASSGGGVWGSITNKLPGATVANCDIVGNSAANTGGGAYQVLLINCLISANTALGGSSGNSGSGGGAESCNLYNCSISGNLAGGPAGGGADNCHLFNCSLTKNNARNTGTGANGGTLVNCTLVGNGNVANPAGPASGAVAGALLTNCIVYGNFGGLSSSTRNYSLCNLYYSDTDPLPTMGANNIDLNPQLLRDNIHLAANSPCIGAGISNAISGTDIDGQPWNNPPAMGCDEWRANPVIAGPFNFQAGLPSHDLTISVAVAGQSPFACFWSKDGVPLQDNGHYSNSGTVNLVVNHFGPADAGDYQVVVTNSSGVVTSAVAQLVIHVVNAAGVNPVPPYSTWDTAATNIQDAINVASVGDIVLVTNGVYAAGGLAVNGNLTNRVAINLPLTVVSVNGYLATVIRGAWDPVATNGPGAVRCAYLADGAILSGFTLQNGATLATGDYLGGPLESGGGVYCVSTNGVVVNCVLTNNSAEAGGGICSGNLDNSLVIGNVAPFGGGAYSSMLNNCTVVNNMTMSLTHGNGAGTCGGITKNCIVVNNYDLYFWLDNYSTGIPSSFYSYSCTSPSILGTGNTNANPQFLDGFNISSTSPCYGVGSAAYASGLDLNGLPWNNPPSMGCAEVVQTNLVGPLLLNIAANLTVLPVNHFDGISGYITGHAARVEWSFGDGVTITNTGTATGHQWTNAGNYAVTFTAYNNDYPAGVSTNMVIQVQPLIPAQLQPAVSATNGFALQFEAQTNATYTIQYTTNLVSPVSWQQLQVIYFSTGGVVQVNDPSLTDGARYYRVLVQ